MDSLVGRRIPGSQQVQLSWFAKGGLLVVSVMMSTTIFLQAEKRMGEEAIEKERQALRESLSKVDHHTHQDSAVDPKETSPAKRQQKDAKVQQRWLNAKGQEDRLHVLVTGGAGYIGSHATLKLLLLGHFVTVVDNLSRGNRGAIQALKEHASLDTEGYSALRFVEGDLGERSVVQDALRNGPKKPDLVIHFAAVAYVGESVARPLQYYHNISMNSIVLLEEMDKHEVTNLVFSSTCATYGNPKHLPVTELTPPDPMSPYGYAKLWVENVIRQYAVANPKFKVGILRYFNVYGCDPDGRLGEWPRPALQQKHGRISNACLDAAAGTVEKVKILGTKHPTRDGTCIRDFIHVSDLVDAHIAVTNHLANPPVLYNVGTGQGVSVRELVTQCKVATGVNFTVEEIATGRPGDSPEIWADNTKIRTELGWSPKYTNIYDGLSHCWKWRAKKLQKGYGSLSGEGGRDKPGW